MKFKPAIQNLKKQTAAPAEAVNIGTALHEGETLKRVAKIHWGIFWKGGAVFLLSLFLMATVFNLGAFFLLVSSVLIAFEYLTKHYLLLALTDKRLIVRHGILNLETVQMHFNRIESVEVFRPPVGRILGYATVLVTGTGSRVTAVPFVADADMFRAELDRMIFEREEKRAARE